MAKYVLSFTPSLEDKKELIVSYTQHTNVYNDNDYIVAFSPWSVYSAEIIDDMARAKKVRVKASKVFLKQGTPLNQASGVIDRDLNKQGNIVSKAQNSNLEKGKLVFSGHVIPSMVEEGLVVLKATVDNEVISYFNAKETNVVSLVNAIREKVTHVANNVGNEWYKEISKTHNVESTAARHLKKIYNALNDQKDSTVLTPFMFMNTEHTLGSLLYKEGYRSDEITYTDTLNDIVIGDTIGSQINSLLLQGAYRAVDIALNSSKLKSKYFTISDSTPYKSQSILYSDEAEMALEKMSITLDMPSTKVELEQGHSMSSNDGNISQMGKAKNIQGTDSEILPLMDKSRAINTREAKKNSPLEQLGLIKGSDSVILPEVDKSKPINSVDGNVFDVTEKARFISPIDGDVFDVTERAKFISPIDGNVFDVTERAKFISPIKGIVTNLTERAKFTAGRLATKPMTLAEAMTRLDKIATVSQVEGALLDKSKIVKEVLEQGKAKVVATVGGRNVERIYNSKFIKQELSRGIGELDDIVFKIKFEATLGNDLDTSIQNSILGTMIDGNEYGNVEEGVLDVILEFLNDSVSTEVEVEVYLQDIEGGKADEGYKDVRLEYLNESDPGIGTKDVELSEEVTADGGESYKDTFITVFGEMGSNPSIKDISISKLEAMDSGAATVDTYVEAVEKVRQQGFKQVFFERLEDSTSNVNSSKDVELDRTEETTTHGNPKDVGLVQIGVFRLDLGFTDTLLDGIESTAEMERIEDVDVDGLSDIKATGRDILDTSLSKLDSPKRALNLKDVSVQKQDVSKLKAEGKQVHVTQLEESLIEDETRETDLAYISNVKLSTEDSILEVGTLDFVNVKELTRDVDLEKMSRTFFESFKELALSSIDTVVSDIEAREVSLGYVESVTAGDSTKDISLEYIEPIVISDATREVSLGHVEYVVADTGTKEVSLSGIEVVAADTGVKDVALDGLTKSSHSKSVKEVHMEGMEKIKHDLKLKDTLLDTLTKIDTQIGIKEVQHEKVVKVSYDASTRETDVHFTDKAERYVEYEGQDNEPEWYSRDDRYYIGTSDGNEGSYVGTVLDIDIPRQNEGGDRTTGMTIGESAVEQSYKKMDLGGALPEDSEGYYLDTRIKADEPKDMEMSENWTVQDIDIKGTEMSENWSVHDINIGGTEEGDRTARIDSISGLNEVARKRQDRGEMAVVEQEGYDLERRVQAELNESDSSAKIDPVLEITKDKVDGHTVDRNFRTGISDSELGHKYKEIECDSDGDGEGGTVIPREPENPVVPPDPKQKIWSIMGKNYPSWQNWNPKKTR